MQNRKKQPIWITIPEKKSSSKESILGGDALQDPDKVNHKTFWALGFGALIIFTAMLMMPGKVSELLQGDLFDGTFQVIPEDATSQGSPFFGGAGSSVSTNSTNDQTENTPSAEQGVQTSEQVSNSSNSSGDMTSSDAEPVQVDLVGQPDGQTIDQTSGQSAEEVSVIPVETDQNAQTQQDSALQAMIEKLSAQLDQLKQDSEEKDQQIQNLNELLQTQAMHEAAKPDTTSAATSSTSSTVQDAGSYRFNTHTVVVNPRDILAQNNSAVLPSEQTQVATQATSSPVMNGALSGVNSQPTTGPMESLMLAFLLSAFGMLAYGIYRRAVS